MTDEITKACSFCDEQISVNAKKCRYCGETVDLTLRMAEEAKSAAAQNPNVFMNAGGGGFAARGNFPHGVHLLGTIFTFGIWAPFWLLFYILRDKNRYW
jgi:ribosomal protein L40E